MKGPIRLEKSNWVGPFRVCGASFWKGPAGQKEKTNEFGTYLRRGPAAGAARTRTGRAGFQTTLGRDARGLALSAAHLHGRAHLGARLVRSLQLEYHVPSGLHYGGIRGRRDGA